MSKPASRQELIDYSLRRLGAPVLEINVDDDQIDDLVDDAIQFYNERHYDGVERMYLKYQITQDDIDLIKEIVQKLDNGEIRVVEKIDNEWVVNEWVKKSISFYFSIQNLKVIESGDVIYFDKLEPKKNYESLKIRVVPPGIVRYGAFCEPGVVVMPGFVNIGAYVSSGTMVDTWATVGSCAYIGKNVHLSGGVGIGGVLEPVQASPTIIEDNCFIGARAEVAEGVIVRKNSVLATGVYLTASTRIVNRETNEIMTGEVPEGSVVVPGSLPSKKPGGPSLYCAVIVKKVDEKTRSKTSINDLLRE